MQLSELELKEIRIFEKQIPSLFTGFIADDSLQGRSNTNAIFSYLIGRGLPFTVSNLTAAVVALQFTLIWVPGTEPNPIAQNTRSTRAPRDTNNGVPRYEGTQYTDRANGIESSWAKTVRLEKEARAQKAAAKEKANRRFKETNQVVQNKINGGVDWAASNALNEAARQRHLAEDAAQSGKPARAQTGFRVIPDNETNFKGPAEAPYTSAELSAYLARRKGGHLMR